VKIRTKLFNALSKTRGSLIEPLKALKQGKLDGMLIEKLEESLISSDVGIVATDQIINKLENAKTNDPLKLINSVLLEQLPVKENIPVINKKSVVLIVGVNGTGKTTTTVKLAYYLTKYFKVMIVGADTYRAAATEQLEEWSRRVNIKLICNTQSNDPSAVLFDGLNSAKKNNYDIVVVDTAGRLHTYKNLMTELEKMVRIADRYYKEFEIVSILTIDASLGQNSLVQAREFAKIFNLEMASY
jgi:fused signal recognition particle receptor